MTDQERMDDIRERMELVRGNGTWVARWYLEDVNYLLGRLAEEGKYIGISGDPVVG
jgi:hypothetical protein